MSTALVFLDTETTGLHAERLPWEIAMIRVSTVSGDPAVPHHIRMFIDEPDLSHAEPMALQIGRFYERHPQANGTALSIDETQLALETTSDDIAALLHIPRGAIPTERIGEHANAEQYDLYREETAMRIVERWTRDATIVGANPAFDTVMLEQRMRFWGLAPSWHHRLVDVEAMHAGRTGKLADKHTLDGLDTIARALDIPVDDAVAHTAMGDAELAKAVFDRMIGYAYAPTNSAGELA